MAPVDLEEGGGVEGVFYKETQLPVGPEREERNPSGVQSFSELPG